MKLTIVEKNFLSWTAMHIDFVMCKKGNGEQPHLCDLEKVTSKSFGKHLGKAELHIRPPSLYIALNYRLFFAIGSLFWTFLWV